MSGKLTIHALDPQRNKAQRILNEALALVEMDEYASMYLPVQPVRGWDEKREEPWRKYLRDDVRRSVPNSEVQLMALRTVLVGSYPVCERRSPDARATRQS
jgi:hypothetical protein